MLPLVFHIGTLLSARNLQAQQVFTISPSRIPGAGTVRTFCFDKTGTLTKSDLDVIGVLPVKLSKGGHVDFQPLTPLNPLTESPDLLRVLAGTPLPVPLTSQAATS